MSDVKRLLEQARADLCTIRVRSSLVYPGQWISVDQEDYIIVEAVPDRDAPRYLMHLGGGPYSEDVAMPDEYIVTMRPITDEEEADRSRRYAAEMAEKQRPWWRKVIG